MTLPRSSGWTRTSSTRPLRSPRLSTRTSSGNSTMPRTRCSRASSSTSVSARRLRAGGLGRRLRRGRGFGWRVGRVGRPGGALRRAAPGSADLGVTGLGVTGLGVTGLGVTGLGVTGLGVTGLGSAALGSAALGIAALGIAALGSGALGVVSARLGVLARLRLGRLVGLARRGGSPAAPGGRLGVPARAGPGLFFPPSPTLSPSPALPPSPALRGGGAVPQGLLDRGGEDLLPVLLRGRRLQRPLGTRQALELLPVAGDLEDLPDRVGGLRPDRQPVLRTVRVDLDERGLGLRVVLADLLDRPPVPLGAGVGDDDPVIGRADLAQALQLDLYSHGCGFLPADSLAGGGRAGWGPAALPHGAAQRVREGPAKLLAVTFCQMPRVQASPRARVRYRAAANSFIS